MIKETRLLLLSIFLTMVFPVVFLTNCCENTTDELNIIADHVAKDSVNTVCVLDGFGTCRKMEIDDYLAGVLLCEMPTSFSEEALKAQAIVARTYTFKRMGKAIKHENCDVCMNSNCCQGFREEAEFLNNGGNVSALNKVRSAIQETDNIVLTYHGDLIDATYFSCSGGMTEDAVAVWGKNVPYLQATESQGEEIAPHFADETRYSVEEFARRLSIASNKEPIDWVESVTLTAGGGVDEIVICGSRFMGKELREILNLRSTAFTISYSDNLFVIKTKGYGHRVGMSQYGAEAMALSGSTYDEILRHYYAGVELIQYAPSVDKN